MRLIVLSIFLLFSNFFYGQEKKMFEDIQITDSMVLIGIYPEADKDKTYEKYDFLISDVKILDSLSNVITYGEVVPNFFEWQGISILLLKNNEIVKRWSVSPKYNNILFNGIYYKFNIDILKKISNKHHFYYDSFKKEFKTKNEFELFYNEIMKDKTFIFMYKPIFDYDGTFDLHFTNKNEFHSPKEISDYIKPKLDEIANKEKFIVMYDPSHNKMGNPDGYKMTIKCKYEIFTKFKDDKSIKKEWVPDKYIAYIFKKQLK